MSVTLSRALTFPQTHCGEREEIGEHKSGPVKVGFRKSSHTFLLIPKLLVGGAIYYTFIFNPGEISMYYKNLKNRKKHE